MPPIDENGNPASNISPSQEIAPEAPLPSVAISDTTSNAVLSPVTATSDLVPEVLPPIEGAVASVETAQIVASTPLSEPLIVVSPTVPETQTAQTVGNEPFTPQPTVVVRRNDVREFLAMAMEKLSGKKQKRLERIMAQISVNGSIANDGVEKLLHCSDASATRYLSELEKQGRITQSGKTGRGVTYRKV